MSAADVFLLLLLLILLLQQQLTLSVLPLRTE